MAELKYLPVSEVCDKLGGISRAYVYRLIHEQGLPHPVHLCAKSVWVNHEIEAWMRRHNAKERVLTPSTAGRAMEYWDLPGEGDVLAQIAAKSARFGIDYTFKPIAPTDSILASQARCNRRRADTLKRMGVAG